MNAIRKCFALLALGSCAFVLSKGIVDMFLRGDDPIAGNPITRLIFATSYLCVALTLLRHGRETLSVLRRNWSLVALVVMAFVSCIWAEMPGLVLQRCVAVLGTSLLGIAIAVRLSGKEQLRLLNWVFRIMAFLSLICVLFFPSYGIGHLAESMGEWQGIFGYKNVLGSMMAMSILVEWHLPADTRFSRVIKWLFVLISFVLLVFSNSVTPLVALAATFFFIEIYRFANQRLRIPLYAIVLVILLILASGITVLAVDSDTVIGALGRSSNFSGRTAIWSMVMSFIAERPILGYGYSGFWFGLSPKSLAVDQALGSSIRYSHNGYLEILLNLGAVGFLFTVAFIWSGMKRAYYWSERDRSRVNLWPLAFLLFFLFYNLGECTILFQDMQWALCISVIASTDARMFEPDTVQVEDGILYAPIGETA